MAVAAAAADASATDAAPAVDAFAADTSATDAPTDALAAVATDVTRKDQFGRRGGVAGACFADKAYVCREDPGLVTNFAEAGIAAADFSCFLAELRSRSYTPRQAGQRKALRGESSTLSALRTTPASAGKAIRRRPLRFNNPQVIRVLKGPDTHRV